MTMNPYIEFKIKFFVYVKFINYTIKDLQNTSKYVIMLPKAKYQRRRVGYPTL